MADHVPDGHLVLNGLLYVMDPKHQFRGVTRSELGVLEQPATIGDATYRSDPHIAAWAISDLTGGIGIEDITGADTTRYRWGTADARSPGNIGLGPLVVATRPTSDSADTLSIVGDVPGTNEELYVAVLESAGLTNLYAWVEATDTWRTASLDIDVSPSSKPVLFRGIGANSFLVIPRGTTTAIGVRTTAAGTLATSTVGLVAASHVAVWDSRVWQLREDSQLLDYTFDVAAAATTVTDARAGGNLILDPAQNVLSVFSWFNLAGESSLFVMTNRSLWAFNDLEESWEHIYDLPPHPCLFRPTAIWRPSEDLWIGVGGSIIRRTPAGVSVILSGPGADGDGLPSGFLGNVHFLEAEFNGLYCLLDAMNSTQTSSLLTFTGTGWFPLWEAPDTGEEFTSWLVLSQASDAYRLWWAHRSFAYTIELHEAPFSPRQGFTLGTDKFAASSYLETGRFWAQTWGNYKIAHRLEIFMENATATETVTVDYQTDTVSSWTTLGAAVTTGRNTATPVPFETRFFGTVDADAVYPGIAFNWIKFRFRFARGATNTLTPIMNAAVLHFVKVRDNTAGFAVSLDMSGNSPDDLTPDEQRVDLRALVEGNRFYTMKYANHTLGVVVAGMTSEEASGADQRGRVTLRLLAIQVVA